MTNYPAPYQSYSPAGPQGARPRADATNLDIAAFIVMLFFPLAGLIMGYVARGQAKRRSLTPCALSTWTLVVGWFWLIVSALIVVVFFISVTAAVVQTGNSGY